MGGLYNMVNGYNPACVIFLPMLGRKYEEYPRFRDCFISEDEQHIDVYTRVGGGNRNCDFGEEKLYEDPNFDSTFDDPDDNTYGTYRFNVPEKWKADFDHIMKGERDQVSDEYVNVVKEFYPSLSDEIDCLFPRKK